MADNFTHGNLRRLSEADLAVAENEPDVRGWSVVSTSGETLGEVDDLIVDTDLMKVRFLEIDPENGTGADAASARYLPIADVDLEPDTKRVIVASGAWTISAGRPAIDIPRAARDAAEDDRQPAQRLTRAEEEVRIGKRTVEAGEVRVGKHVETEHRHHEVALNREDVHVERRPVTDGGDRSAEIRASDVEIVVPVVEEEVTVEKRPIVKEELIISKEQKTERRPVDVEVRKEEFDVRDERAPRHKGEQ